MNQIIVFAVLGFLWLSVLPARIVESGSPLTLQPGSRPVLLPGSFVVAGQDIVLIDARDACIKFYTMKGLQKSVFGRKGLGPNEFMMPKFSTLHNGQLLVRDLERRMLCTIDLTASGPKWTRSVLDRNMANCMVSLDERQILMAGYMFLDGDFCSLAVYDLVADRIVRKLIYFRDWIGALSRTEIMKKISLGEVLSVSGFADWDERFFFFVPGAQTQIFRIDRRNGQRMEFGVKSSRFHTFHGDQNKLKKLSPDQSKRKEWMKLVGSVSQVHGLWIMSEERLGLVFSSFNDKRNRLDIYIQTYSFDGSLCKEELMMEADADNFEALTVYNQRDRQRLWILDCDESDAEGEVRCTLHQFVFETE